MNNPEFRQTLHNISHNLESANQTAQENIYTFTQLYLDPCIDSFKACITDCTAPCFASREDNLRRKRGRSRGRAEYNFDFYDAWDDDADDLTASGMGWGDDELDSLLAGRGPTASQPKRPRAMSYGSRGRRKSQPQDGEPDPTVIPSSAYLGFLERLPWKIGTRQLRYKPSAADLQVNPGGMRLRDGETEPLVEEHEDEEPQQWRKGHGRQRSDTANSKSTSNSLSSRGDLIMSDEEDDAVPLDDEFAVALSRRMTGQGFGDDHVSGKQSSPNGKRPIVSRRSTRTASSKSLSSKSQRSASQKTLAVPLSPVGVDEEYDEPPTMLDLRRLEEEVAQEEELEIQQKRDAAQRLAVEKGLSLRAVSKTTADMKLDSGYKSESESESELDPEPEPEPSAVSQRQSTDEGRPEEMVETTTRTPRTGSASNPPEETDGKDPT